jgi:hypothetical protein
LHIPVKASLAGYGALIERFGPTLPQPPRLTVVGGHQRPTEVDGWLILSERYRPADDLAAQLTFALKWEGMNLAVLDALFRSCPKRTSRPPSIRHRAVPT